VTFVADVSLKQVRKNFGAVEIIKEIDLDIAHGEFIVFVGPSGCGKSTLLRLVAGLEEITSGTISIGGKVVNDLPPKDRSVAMVFQSYALFPHMTVRDNVAFGLKISKAPQAEIEAKVAEAARMLKLEQLLDRKPSQLSGGQRQRVAIGRAIVRRPEVFLFDEPLSNLDAALRVGTRAEIAKLHRELGATMIYVTHDQVEAMTLADRIVVLDAGVVRQFGSPLELYHMPKNQFVAGFMGSPKMNFLKVEIKAVNAKGVVVEGPSVNKIEIPVDPSHCKVGDIAMLGIRPEHTLLRAGAGQGTGANVSLVEMLGHQTFVECETTSHETCAALLDGMSNFAVGERINISFKSEDCHLFSADGSAFTRMKAPAIPKPKIKKDFAKSKL
jgi:multiple sugar transport system ATP-binding protein